MRCLLCFFFKQKTAYDMRISDWSSDVCSSDLDHREPEGQQRQQGFDIGLRGAAVGRAHFLVEQREQHRRVAVGGGERNLDQAHRRRAIALAREIERAGIVEPDRSEEHTSELQSLMRISYAVFCLKKKNKQP